MYVLTYIMTRPDPSVPWFSRPEEINRQFGIEKREGRLIFDEFEISSDGNSGTYTATWDTKESYEKFIGLPMMKSFRDERQKYNQQTGCTILLLSEVEV
jgi:hypothetical protein